MATYGNIYEKYSYHYKKEYPINMFIKVLNKKKVKIKKDIICKNICVKNSIENNVTTNIGDMYKKIGNNINESKRGFDKLVLNYYNNYKNNKIDCKNNNSKLNEHLIYINFKKKDINKYNAETIYIYYNIYNSFLMNLNHNGSNLYKYFKIFIKKNEIMETINNNNITLNLFYKYSEKSYTLINSINKNIDKEKIINLMILLELNMEKLYKLNKTCMNLLIDFLKHKYYKIYTNQNDKINYTNIKGKHNITDINKLCKDIPITYIGSKRKISSDILNYISLNINNNTKTYIELFGGSLCISYLIKNLYPHLNIIVYENDRLLINFYNVLKDNYEEFILTLKNMVNKLKISNNQYDFLRNIVDEVNKKLVINDQNDINLACYYYFINKLSYKGILNYNNKNKINVTFNKKRINAFTKFNIKHENKLCKYSLFLKNIQLINMDISKNYNKILNLVNNKTIIYADPPYYKENHKYTTYQNILDKSKQTDLKIFLDNVLKKGCNWIKNNHLNGYIMELYDDYKQTILKFKNNICGSLKSDLLIASF